MLDKKNIPIKKPKPAALPIANSSKVVDNISNWYSDRYNSIVIQRNLLLILLIASVIIVAVSVFVVGNISSTFKIQPFVIDVEDRTGITEIVNPLANKELTSNDSLNKYFLMKYVNAREGYSTESWRYNYLTVVRLLSTPTIYRSFRRFLNTSPASPLVIYGNQLATSVAFRSVQLFPGEEIKPGIMGDSQAVIRFTVYLDNGSGSQGRSIHKILTVNYRYEQSEMSEEDRQINPLGFYITSYRSDVESNVVNN